MNPSQFNLLNAAVTGNTYKPNGGIVPVSPSGQVQAFGQFSAPQSPSVLGDSTIASTGTVTDPAAAQAAANAAANDAAINGALGRLDAQQNVGNQNILNSYNSAYQRLVNSRTQGLSNLDQNRNQTIQDNIVAKDNINTGVRQTNLGLQRLLGAHGSGSSSASSVLAPYAAGLQGNQQQAQVQNAFARNLNAIDQSKNDLINQYDTSFGDLNAQKQQQQNSLLSGIAQNRASLLGQRSDANNNVGTINSILNGAVSLGLNPTFTPKAVTATIPDLAQYDYTKTTAPTTTGDVAPATAQQLGIYSSLLGEDKRKSLAGA